MRHTAVARVRKILEHPFAQKYIGQFLPTVEGERSRMGIVMSQSLECVDAKPEIAECDASSIVRAVGRAASWNLRIGPRGPALLIANEDERGALKLAAMQNYEGKIAILRREKLAPFVMADIVCDGEPIEYVSGTNPDIKHVPSSFKLEARGKIAGSYAWTYVVENPTEGYRARDRVKRIAAVSRGEIIAHMNQWSPRLKGANLDEMPMYALARAVHKLAKLIAPSESEAGALLTDDADDNAWRADLTLTADGLIEPQSPQEDRVLGRRAPTETVVSGKRPSVVLSTLNAQQEDPYALDRAVRTTSKL
jgi:recombinational DNA repair protein RecT